MFNHDGEKEKIICAAVWILANSKERHFNYCPTNIEYGYVVGGFRHGDIYENLYNLGVPKEDKKIEGFLTSKNRFLDRQEASALCIENEQLVPEYIDTLYSEDLY